MKPSAKILLLVFVLFTSLACTIFIGGPEYSSGSIPVSTEAVGELQASVQTAMAVGTQSGEITLVFTETQLTSYLAMKLAEQPEPFLSDPYVSLQNGQIAIFGTARQGVFKANLRIALTAGIDPEGALVLTVDSIDFGPLPVPQGVNEALTATIQEAFTGAVGPAAIGFRLETISIAEGVLTLTGRLK